MLLEEFLFKLRIESNKTPQEMSKMLKLTENRYKDIEGKKVQPTIKEICTINIYLKANGYAGYNENEMINKYKPAIKKKNAVRYISNIRYLRCQNDLSIQELADSLQVHRTTIYKWESGLKKPSQERITILQEILGAKIEIREVEYKNDKAGV